MLVNDINWVEREISPIVKNTLSLYAVETVSGRFMMDSDTMLVRAAKRGVLWTLSENLESEVMTMNSDIRNMNFWGLADRSIWNGVVAGVIEASNAFEVVDGVVGAYTPPSELRNAFETALLIWASRKLTDKFDTQLKNMTSFLRTK